MVTKVQMVLALGQKECVLRAQQCRNMTIALCLRMSIAPDKTDHKAPWGQNDLFQLTSLRSHSITKGNQDRNSRRGDLRLGTEVETIEELW